MLSNHSNLICEGKQINNNSGIYEKIGIPTTSSGLVNSSNTGAKVICQRIFDRTIRVPCYTSFPKAVISGVEDLDTLTQIRAVPHAPYIPGNSSNKQCYVLITHYLNDHFEEEAIRIDFKYKGKDTLTFYLPMDYDVSTAAAMYYDEWTLSYDDGGQNVDLYKIPIASLRVDSNIYTIEIISFQETDQEGKYATALYVEPDSEVLDTGSNSTDPNFSWYTKYPAPTDDVWFASNFEQIEFLFNFESSGDVSNYIDAKMTAALKDFSNYFCVR